MTVLNFIAKQKRKRRLRVPLSLADQQAARDVQAMLDAASPDEIAALRQAFEDAEDAANRLNYRLDVVHDLMQDIIAETRLAKNILTDSNARARADAENAAGLRL